MSAATVYEMEIDAMTAELDVSSLPDETGVYAVFDDERRLRYIGLSRKISKSVAGHGDSIGVQEVGRLIREVRCLTMPDGTKESLKAVWEHWIREHMDGGGEIPTGNMPEGSPGADPRWRSKAGATRPPLNLAGVRGITSMPEALDAVKRCVNQYPVVLFMKGSPAMPQCGFSAKTVGLLRETGVQFEAVNILDDDANPGVREAVKQYSNWPTIPQLFIRGELVGGADIVAEMMEAGELVPKLKGATDSGAAAEGASSGGGEASSVGTVQSIDDPKRPTASLISRTLGEKFQLAALNIVDESAAHEGDAGALEMGLTSESHFRLEIVAPEFAGLPSVQRQQKVFDALSEVMPKIHALSLVTKTPAEA